MEVEEYLQLRSYSFTDDKGTEQTINIPAGDIFHQFRKDVDSGNLPTVSWLAAPQAFSDHTSSPLYGTWYVSEALNILTKNPEVWKKTIFILNYDENDGYYDHLPPFVVPNPGDPTTGKVSAGIDIDSDFDRMKKWPIGLGYRVPMIVASPWSRGGFVNSQIHDHTSTLMFLEKFLQKKTGKNIVSNNISSWRRHVCGDLSSVFRPYNGERYPLPDFLKKTQVIDGIQNAKNKPAQVVPKPLSEAAIQSINKNQSFSGQSSKWMAEQEKGTRPACALPYILYADCHLDKNKNTVELQFNAGANEQGIGTAFNVYTPSTYKKEAGRNWFYTVKEKDVLTDSLDLNSFDRQIYDLCIHGANGFFRHYKGDTQDPALSINCKYEENKGLSAAIPEM
ncbi:alkaline phosphatase family protein [Niabella hibiscisoli]|uniref:alkaline phosphatase family protein n=1 Tax=Niabella hibiscisoli TaxID=1825928 RepID=UPI00374D757E